MEISDAQFQQLNKIKIEIREQCKLCKNKGFFVDFAERKATLCICTRIFRYIMDLYLAGIPRDYWTLHLNFFETVPEQYRWFIKNYILNLDKAVSKGLGFLFYGSNGVGKTSLMVEVGKYALRLGHTVSYFTLQEYIYSTYSDNDDTVDIDADILIVDEIDKVYIKRGSEYTPKTVEELFRNRLHANKVIMAAGNFTPDALKDMFGVSVLSMLKRKMKIIELPGNDFSSTKQDMWTKDLLDDFDYYHPNILKMVKMKDVKESLKDDHS